MHTNKKEEKENTHPPRSCAPYPQTLGFLRSPTRLFLSLDLLLPSVRSPSCLLQKTLWWLPPHLPPLRRPLLLHCILLP